MMEADELVDYDSEPYNYWARWKQQIRPIGPRGPKLWHRGRHTSARLRESHRSKSGYLLPWEEP
jgi:hypothetical protein